MSKKDFVDNCIEKYGDFFTKTSELEYKKVRRGKNSMGNKQIEVRMFLSLEELKDLYTLFEKRKQSMVESLASDCDGHYSMYYFNDLDEKFQDAFFDYGQKSYFYDEEWWNKNLKWVKERFVEEKKVKK